MTEESADFAEDEARPPSRLKRAIWIRLKIYGGILLIVVSFGWYWISTPHRRESLDESLGRAARDEAGAKALNLAERLHAHVARLCAARDGRYPGSPALDEAKAFIIEEWSGQGHSVVDLPYTLDDGTVVSNLLVEIPGIEPDLPIVVCGAHYDTVRGTPGADDNGSGTALLLELGRGLVGEQRRRTIQLVAFACEEPPYFKSDEMGSLVYARRLQAAGTEVLVMLSLECLGYFTDQPNTQNLTSLPAPLRRLYPDRGNFVGIVGGFTHRAWVAHIAELLRSHCEIPLESAAIPALVAGVDWSDHWSFWQIGEPGLLLTDTAIFRNPAYHGAKDLPATLNYPAMAELSRGLTPTILALADE